MFELFLFPLFQPLARANRASYCLLYMSMRLGYYVSQHKSELLPTQRLVHLGYGIDNSIGAYFITDKHRAKFRARRDLLLRTKEASLLDLQSFVGKCNHLRLVFPAVSLFTIHCRRALSSLGEIPAPLSKEVLDEIAFWSFVDSVTDPIPFRLHRHASITLSSDASGYAWGAQIVTPCGPLILRDYWTADCMPADICVKEGLAVLLALSSIVDSVRDHRVDVYSDNHALTQAWSGLKCSSSDLAGVLRSLFLLCCEYNLSVKLIWIPSEDNVADAPSRLLRRSDASLVPELRNQLWDSFGPFSIDLMALPSNAFRRPSGASIPFFSPTPMPSSEGANVFSQERPCGVAYAFPPFVMIPALIRLLQEWGSVEVVLVLPFKEFQVPAWSTSLSPFVLRRVDLFSPGSVGVLSYPSQQGFQPNSMPTTFGLAAVRCRFPPASPRFRPLLSVNYKILVVSDSVLRPLENLRWPPPFEVTCICVSGAKLSTAVEVLLRMAASEMFDAFLVHAGVNDVSRISNDAVSSAVSSAVSLKSSLQSSLDLLGVLRPESRIILSSVCQSRKSSFNVDIAVVNSLFRKVASARGWRYVSHDIIHFDDLKDDVHLNASGIAKLYRSLLHGLRQAFGIASPSPLHPSLHYG